MRLGQMLSCAMLGAVLPLAGCHRRVKLAALPLPPPIPVEMISVPPASHPSEPEPEIPLAEVPAITPQLPRRTLPRYRPAPATPAQTAALSPQPPPPPVDLGQLTTGDDSGNGALLQQTESLLRGQQRRLIALSKALAAMHSQQVDQARLFLRQAEDAWKKLDVEGTRTLATKAKVLLDEIQSSAANRPPSPARPVRV